LIVHVSRKFERFLRRVGVFGRVQVLSLGYFCRWPSICCVRIGRPFAVCCAFAGLFFGNSAVFGSEEVEDEDEVFCSATQQGCVAIGEWDISIGLGLGLRSNPLINGEDLPIFILPEIRYYGEKFFLDTYTGGYTFFDSGAHLLNAVVTIGFDQIYFKSRSIGNVIIESGPFLASTEPTLSADEYTLEVGTREAPTPSAENIDIDLLHSRNTAGLVGLEYGYYNRNWDASVQLLQDFTQVHNGQEVRAAVSRFMTVSQESVELAAGFSWQSADLLQYYYGVERSEVGDGSLAYSPSSGVSPFVRLDWRRRLLGNWTWQATMHYRWLSSQIEQSPLLDEDDVLTVYFGGVYHF